MILLLISFILFISMLFYFRIANHFNIIDKPNERSSHSLITIRGGGIIFPLAILLYAVFFQEISLPFLLGMILIGLISFWDDISSLPNKLRLLVHLIAVTCLLWTVNAFIVLPLGIIIVVYILVIGMINAYNFMDGINGITGLYSLVTLLGLQYVNLQQVHFINENMIWVAILACLIFLIFNFRTKAVCFAGDVGSVTIAYWIIALLFDLIITTGNWTYILFLTVYGIDTILTIMHRIILSQNIFKAHRLHFYQILANERKIPHLFIATTYSFIQLIINTWIVTHPNHLLLNVLIVCLPLALIYIVIKPKLMQQK